MELERSSSIISAPDPIRLVLEATATEAEVQTCIAEFTEESSTSILGSTRSRSRSSAFAARSHNAKGRGKVKAVGGTSTINSSHYVDFCSDPTTDFPEFQDPQPQSRNTHGQTGNGIDKMLNPWTYEHEQEAEPVVAPPSTIIVQAPGSQSQTGLHGQGHPRPPPAPPRTTMLGASAPLRVPSESGSGSVVACLQGPSCPHCTGLTGLPVSQSHPPPPPRIRAAAGANAFSSTSFSLKPWQWPRRSKPIKSRSQTQRDRDVSSSSASAALGTGSTGSRLFFTSPYTYFGFGRGRPSRLLAASKASSSSDCASASSSCSAASASASQSSNSFGSASALSAPRSLPSCLVHSPSPIRIRPTQAATSCPSATSPYYYLRKYGYGTGTGTGAEDDDKDLSSWSSSCCKKIKYKSRKNSASAVWGNSYGHASSSGKRHAQALRTFQLICLMLCALGIATLLVISILSSIARTGSRVTHIPVLHSGDDATSDRDGVSLIDDLLVSNAAGDIEPEDLPLPAASASIRDQLKVWLFKNPAAAENEDEPGRGREQVKNRLLNVTNFKFLLNNEAMCQNSHTNARSSSSASMGAGSGSEKLYFMILVHSAPKHFQQRQAIRSTWGSVKSVKNLGVRLIFLLGQPPNEAANSSTIKFTRNNPTDLLQRSILAEHALYGDIVQGNFQDTYRNLIYKHLMGYKWVLRYCDDGEGHTREPHRGTTFVLKTDDDVFIDIFQLIDFTTRHYGLEPTSTIICNVYEGTFPIRPPKTTNAANSSWEPLSKWAVTSEEYPLAVYPKYCGGLAYLITPDVIGRLVQVHERVMAELQTSNRTLRFWIDDVYVTGVLRELARRDPYYMNLRYAYDAKLYQPWMLNDAEFPSSRPKTEAGLELALEEQEHEHENPKTMHKIPYMIVHLEQKATLSEEMNRLWRKTMRVWH